jgi:hypothetical protein
MARAATAITPNVTASRTNGSPVPNVPARIPATTGARMVPSVKVACWAAVAAPICSSPAIRGISACQVAWEKAAPVPSSPASTIITAAWRVKISGPQQHACAIAAVTSTRRESAESATRPAGPAAAIIGTSPAASSRATRQGCAPAACSRNVSATTATSSPNREAHRPAMQTRKSRFRARGR